MLNIENRFIYNVKELRRKNMLTQQQVADKLKIDRSTYACYECGFREPNLQTIEALCKILKCDYNKLFK